MENAFSKIMSKSFCSNSEKTSLEVRETFLSNKNFVSKSSSEHVEFSSDTCRNFYARVREN